MGMARLASLGFSTVLPVLTSWMFCRLVMEVIHGSYVPPIDTENVRRIISFRVSHVTLSI